MSGLDFTDYNFQFHKRGGHVVNYQPARLTSSGNPLYNGFLANDSSWIIMERNTTNGTIKYVRGASGFVAAWAARATQTYTEYSELFT